MSTDPRVIDTPVDDELRTSFLSYAMSVIVSRALPDVRDGLKPVHRRILYAMEQMNLLPSRGYVKSARVVGEAMGKYHPHGDSAIYEALVRMAQDWSMRIPLVDGHGNFGSQTDAPASMRYTEARMTATAVAMTDELDEDTVDFTPNYDGSTNEPTVLPAAFPNLLVNGAEGIAVGMATKMAPHNLTEVVEACKHVLHNPDATVDDLLKFVPAPDLPTGGTLLGLDGAREAYRTGRGTFVMRAVSTIEDVSARKKGIVVTELPYQVGPEHVIAAIKKQREQKRLAGVSNVMDLSDRKVGLRLVIECKSGYQPQAVLDELLRLTPLQTNFNVHNLALVDGQPRTLNLREMVGHYVTHRVAVTTRRSQFRRNKAQARAHLLEGFLIALASIEEVVRTIRAAKDTAAARKNLTRKFKLSETQANAVLEMPLRRLTGLEVEKITSELDELNIQIADLTTLLNDPEAMNTRISAEMDEVVAKYGTPRRSRLSDADPTVRQVHAAEAKIPNSPCTVTLSATGLISYWTGKFTGTRTKHDALVAQVDTTTHSVLSVVTSHGRVLTIPVMELPTGEGKNRGGALTEFVDLTSGEHAVALVDASDTPPLLAMGTRQGVVKVLNPADWPKKSGQDVIRLGDGDMVVGACVLPDGDVDLVFITTGAQLLRTPAGAVRPQGRTGGGVAGVKLGDDAAVVSFTAVGADQDQVHVVTVAGGSAGTSVKRTPVAQFPTKGRATGGVRAHRLLRGEDALVTAGVGVDLVGVAGTGALVVLPQEEGKRDGAGTRTEVEVRALAVRR